MERKVENPQELSKYRLYVDELDKVMCLLLRLSSRLARAENELLALPQDASQGMKVGKGWLGQLLALPPDASHSVDGMRVRDGWLGQLLTLPQDANQGLRVRYRHRMAVRV